MTEKRITLIRHAQSIFNANNDMTKNGGITEEGKRVASQLRGSFDLVICSTLKRARQTLDYSEIEYSSVVFTDLCRERMDGNPTNCFNGQTNFIESDEDFKCRIFEFKIMLKKKAKKYNKICVISHNGFLYQLCGINFGNCQYLMDYQNKF